MALSAAVPAPTAVTSKQSDRLWEKAFISLDSDIKLSFGPTRTYKRDILAAVLKAAEEKRQICLRKRWKFKKSNGDEVIIRDVLEKVTKWIERFISIGDVAVQFDSTNASLPWAAVRFLLQATINDVQLFGAMVNNLEVIARLITRCREFEVQLLQWSSALKSTLEEALTCLYAEVLTYLGQTVAFFKESTPIRMVKSPFRVADSSEIQKILAREDEVFKLAKLADTETLHFIQNTVIRVSDQTATLERILDEEKYTKMLKWLSISPYSHHHYAISDTRTPDFGHWLFKHSEYRDWNNSSSSSILLLHGIVGSGKTNLCSVVIDSFLTIAAKNSSAAPFAYFYCSTCEFEPERTSPEEVLRSILRQLAINRTEGLKVREFLWSEYERRAAAARVDGMELSRLRVEECVKLILELTGEDPISIVVDAIDEIPESDRYVLLKALIRIATEADNVVKVFLTSRTESKILATLETSKKINITPRDTRSDMEVFVRQQLDNVLAQRRLLNGNISSSLRRNVSENPVNGAGEMFLWAKLQIEHLCKKKHEDDIISALKSNSVADLDKLYEETLSRILESGAVACDVAIKVFSWTLYMKEPLTPPALLAALTTTAMSTSVLQLPELLDLCFNLVILDTECNVVRFAHYSVQEYLRRQELFADAAAHRLLASACLAACSLGPPSTFLPASKYENFYFYAAVYWPIHFQNLRVTDQEDSFFKQLISFIFDEGLDASLSFEIWLDSVKEIVKVLPDDHTMKLNLEAIQSAVPGPLFLAAVFGLDGLLNLLSTTSPEQNWDQRNDLGHTAIYLTAVTGHFSTTSILIEQGAEINVNCGKYGSPLHAACFSGHTEVVLLLLKHGASTTCGTKFSNALEAAFRGDREDVALCLIQHGSMIDTEEDYERTVQSAAQAGFLRLIDWLERPAVASSFRRGTPDRVKAKTAKAIRGGQMGVLQRFLSNTNDPTALLPHDAVAIAALYGNNDLISFLLDKGMGIETEGMFGSPLRTASLMDHKPVVELLLKRGADVNACGSMGDALHVAAVKGHTQIMQLLIQEGSNVNQHTGFYGNALQAAAYHGHKGAVELLLKAGADVHDSGYSIDAFHAAAEGGHQDIVLYLLDKGYKYRDPPPPPEYARMVLPRSRYRPLMRDASPGRDKDSDRQDEDSDGQRSEVMDTLPSLPPTKQHISDFEAVFKAATEFSELDETAAMTEHPKPSYSRCAYCPLEASAAAGHESVVSILLRQRKRLDISDREVTNAMKAAAQNGHLSVVEILLDYVAAQMPTKAHIRSIFDAAHANKQTHIVEFALDLASRHAFTDEVNEMRLEILKGFNQEHVVSDFVCGCETGNVDTINRILQSDHLHLLDSREVDKGLELAATNGLLAPVHLLLESEKLSRKPTISDELFVSVAMNGHVEVMKCLVSHNPSIHTSPMAISQGLIMACRKGHADMVGYLVRELAADVNDLHTNPVALDTSSSNRTSPCPSSSSSSSSDALDSQNNTDDTRREPELLPMISPLQATLQAFETYKRGDAYYKGHEDSAHILLDPTAFEDVIRLLLNCGSNPNDLGGRYMYPIQVASAYCPDGILKQLIDAGADVNATNERSSALEAACRREISAASVVRRLLEAGATLPTDQPGRKKLVHEVLAFFVGDTARKSFSCEAVNPDGRFLMTPSLEYVFKDGPGAVLYILLSQFEEEQAHDTRYGLVLQMASFLNDQAFVELLLSRRVDVNAIGYYYGTALQAAARCGHKGMIERLLEVGADVNIIQGRWHMALRAAVVGGNNDVVRLLIGHGADVNFQVRNSENWEERDQTVLQLALRTPNPDIVETLLAAGANVSEVDIEARVPHPLILSARQGNIAIVQALLGAGAPVNASSRISDNDATPLHAAIRGGHLDIIRFLLDCGADVNKEIDERGTPLYHATNKSHLQAVRLLLAAGADVNCNYDDTTPLQVAARDGHLCIVQELLAAGAKVSEPPHIKNALSMACRESKLLVVETLLEAVCAYDNRDQIVDEAFLEMIESPNDEVYELLLDYVPGTAKRLLYTCAAGVQSSVECIIDQGIGVDAEEEETGNRPLHIAALYLQPDIVHTLIDHGPDVQIKSKKYGTPLMAALEGCIAPLLGVSELESTKELVARLSPPLHINTSSRGYCDESMLLDFRHVSCSESIVRLLVENGADVNVGCEGFGFPLHLAALVGSKPLIKLLLDKGADVYATGGYLKTALFAAIEGNNPDIVLLLLQHGAHIDDTHEDFGTPLHLACTIGNTATVRRLLEYGAVPSVGNKKGETPFTIVVKHQKRYYFSQEQRESLLDIFLSLGPRLRITEEDLLAASELSEDNSLFATLVELDKNLTVSEDIIIRAMWYIEYNLPNLRLLMDRNGGIGVTEKMLRTFQSSNTLKVLLEYRPICKITPEILEAQKCLESINILLEHDADVIVTEALVVRSLEVDGSYHRRMLEMLWERNPHLTVTPAMLKAAKDVASMEFLLQHLEPGSGVSDDVIAAQHEETDFQLDERFRMLFRHDPSVQVSMATIINSISDVETLAVFLEHDPELLITEEILFRCSSGYRYDGEKYLKQLVELLSKYGKTIVFTKKIRETIDRVFQCQSDLPMKKLLYSLRATDANDDGSNSAKTPATPESSF